MSVKSWQRRASPLARQALAGYAILIVYGSLYPFSGWRSLGLGPYDYLFGPPPQYLTSFDVLTNVLGYLPLGGLAVLALYPRWRGGVALCAAVGLSLFMSSSLEALQTYLPSRVASNFDLASNLLGGFLGAALATPAASALLDRGGLRRLRFRWFERRASFLLGLIMLWPFAQMFPEPFLFGLGDWPRELWQSLDASMQSALLAWLPAFLQRDALALGSTPPIWEAWVTGLNVLGAGLLVTLALRPTAPRLRLLAAFLALTLAIKAGATVLQSHSGLLFDWFTAGARAGLLGGCVAVLAAMRLPQPWRAALCVGALSLALALANLVPLNPYYDVLLDDWRQGRYLHFNGLAQWLAWTWPYLTLGWLAASAERAWVTRARGPQHDRTR